jgi:RND family efflux transporter MFP subunit
MSAPKKLYFITIPIGVILTTTLITLWLIKNPPPIASKAQADDRYPVQVTQLMRGNYQPNATLYGHVVSNQISSLTAGVQADIEHIYIKPGDAVKKGQLLIRLSDQSIQLSLTKQRQAIKSALASIAVEKLNFINQRNRLKHDKMLYQLALTELSRTAYLMRYMAATNAEFDADKIKAIEAEKNYQASQTEVNAHTFRLKQLLATLKQSKAQLAQYYIDQKKTQIKAPFSGWITARAVAPGERTQIGQTLVTLYDKKNLEIKCNLPTSLHTQLKNTLHNAKPIEAQIEYAGDTMKEQWQLTRLSADIAAGQTTPSAYFTTQHTSLPLGAPVNVHLSLPRLQHLFRIPIAGVFRGNTIYYVTPDNRLKSLTIQVLGQQSLDGKAYILFQNKALNEDAFVLTQSLPKAKEGLHVRLLHDG